MNEQVTNDADSAPAREISPTPKEQPREETAEATAFLWRNVILLGLLLLLSFCGCWAEFGQDMEGVC